MAYFKTEAINERLIEEVKDYIEQENRLLLENLIDEMRPADVADLIEHLEPDVSSSSNSWSRKGPERSL